MVDKQSSVVRQAHSGSPSTQSRTKDSEGYKKKAKVGVRKLGNKEGVFLGSEGTSGWSVSQAVLAASGAAKVSN